MIKKIAIEIILFGMIISILHQIALSWYLYWTTDWFDIIMHFLGGFLMALLVLLIVVRLNLISQNKIINFILIVGGALFIGLAWELFELFTNMTDIATDKGDTILDLVMDTVGAVSAYHYSFRKFFKS